MDTVNYTVTQKEGAWTIRFGGRYFDQFGTALRAVRKASEWARNARIQGHESRVLVERSSGESIVIPIARPHHGGGATAMSGR